MVKHLKEIYQYRDLLKNLVARDLTVRYKRSILGFFWTMVNPSANAHRADYNLFYDISIPNQRFYLIFSVRFFTLDFFRLKYDHLLSAVLMGGSAIFKKIYVPKSIFVISVICSEMVNFFLASITLLLLTLIMRHSLPLSLLFWPVSFLLIILFTLGVALLLSATSIFFYDIIEGYQILLMPWMYLTPIMYPLRYIPPQYQIFIKLNPMYYYVECFRIPLYVGQLPGWDVLTVAIAISFISLLLGYKAFNRLGDDFIFYV